MNMKKIEELSGFRKPNEQERKSISCYFQNVFQGTIRTCKNVSTILCVIGVLAMGSYGINGVVGIGIGLLAFAAAFAAIWTKKKYEGNIQILKNGQFQVLEGKVIEMSTNTEYPGVANVRFQSVQGEVMEMLCTVRMENLQIGTPLLLAYVDKSTIKGGISRAFTPYMLTEEGMKHWL